MAESGNADGSQRNANTQPVSTQSSLHRPRTPFPHLIINPVTKAAITVLCLFVPAEQTITVGTLIGICNGPESAVVTVHQVG